VEAVYVRPDLPSLYEVLANEIGAHHVHAKDEPGEPACVSIGRIVESGEYWKSST
jgi:hypothetical protein